jgi:hypothetical protein
MKSICTLVVLAGLTWAGGELAGSASAADTMVPAVTHLRAAPSKFCARRSSRCHHPGTEIRFSVSTDATVTADLTPRFQNLAPYFEFSKHFKRGANQIRLNDSRLTPGRWTLRLQAKNHVGSGGISVTDVHVVKHD